MHEFVRTKVCEKNLIESKKFEKKGYRLPIYQVSNSFTEKNIRKRYDENYLNLANIWRIVQVFREKKNMKKNLGASF